MDAWARDQTGGIRRGGAGRGGDGGSVGARARSIRPRLRGQCDGSGRTRGTPAVPGIRRTCGGPVRRPRRRTGRTPTATVPGTSRLASSRSRCSVGHRHRYGPRGHSGSPEPSDRRSRGGGRCTLVDETLQRAPPFPHFLVRQVSFWSTSRSLGVKNVQCSTESAGNHAVRELVAARRRAGVIDDAPDRLTMRRVAAVRREELHDRDVG